MALSFSLSAATPLNAASIDAKVSSNKPGVYVLGPATAQGAVTVNYVGRSDGDLAGRLKQHAVDRKSTHFVFAYASSILDAYAKECELYHEWPNALKGQIHPAAPPGTNARCKICGL